QIKERSPKTPVIVVTGFTDAKDCAALNTNCVDAVIRKPFTLKDFESTVQRVLNTQCRPLAAAKIWPAG
ncbi:MAG: hypothetical protein ACM34H_06710, partial [Deltaproteobacteria bacterium]